jgi:aromatic ring-opening dioxygenase catalytic subunit (LigB family)
MRQPTFFIPHGGGLCFFMDWTMGTADTWDALRAWLAGLIGSLAERPAAILIATAHWEADPVRVTAMAAVGLIYDYGGFPPHTYELTWPAPGSPSLAERVRKLLGAADIVAALETERGFDHGVFVPLKGMIPRRRHPDARDVAQDRPRSHIPPAPRGGARAAA